MADRPVEGVTTVATAAPGSGRAFGLEDTETAIRTLARAAPGREEAIHVVVRPG